MKCRALFFILLNTGVCLCNSSAMAQCSSSSGATYKGTIIPTSSFQPIATVNAGEYWNFVATVCSTYVFSFCTADGGSALWNTEITINDNTGTSILGAYNNNSCSAQSYLEWTPSTNGTYRIYVTKFLCSNSSPSSGTLMYKVIPLATTTSEYTLVGSATAPSGCATLTQNAINNIGCAWDVNSTLDFNASFSYDFTINLGSSDGGADGLCFVMQNDPEGLCVCGGSGGGMGAAGITNSVIVEMDTYLNYEDRDDGITGVSCSGGAEPDHIDLWLNGNVNPTGICGSSAGARIIPSAVPLMNGASTYNIENGIDHTLRISWIPAGATGTLTVSVMNSSASTTYATFSYTFNPSTVFGTLTPYFGFTASTGALSNQQSACLSPVLLPIELGSFTATCLEGKEVLVEWKTISELNNAFFSIERSEDGIHFSEMMRLPGAGTSTIENQYGWSDVHPVQGLAYYRLMHTAYNGNKVYSPAISVTCTKTLEPFLSAYTGDNGYLNIVAEGINTEGGLIQLIDISGRIRAALTFEPQAEQHPSASLYTGNIPRGIYLVTLNTTSHFYCTRAVIFR